jgi:hypothetical protein
LASLATEVRTVAHGLDQAATELQAISAGSWIGRAATAFQHTLHQQPGRYATGAIAFGAAASAIDAYAAALDQAQQAAGRAITSWEDAEAASAAWRQRRDAASTLGYRGSAVPANDPGDAGRASAQQMLDGAHAALDNAAAQLRATLSSASSDAPNRPSLFGQLVADLERFLKQHQGEVAFYLGFTTVKDFVEALAAAKDVHEFLPVFGFVNELRNLGETDPLLGELTQDAIRTMNDNLPLTAQDGLAAKALANLLNRVPAGQNAASWLSDASRAGPWFRGLGIFGGVIGTGTGGFQTVEDISHHRSGSQVAEDITGTAFSATSTAFLIAPNPVTGTLAAASGVAYAGAIAWNHREAIGQALDDGVDIAGSAWNDATHVLGGIF